MYMTKNKLVYFLDYLESHYTKTINWGPATVLDHGGTASCGCDIA